MPKPIYHLVFTGIFLFLAIWCPAQSFTAMTYNIRYDNPNDGENRWDNRKARLVEQVRSHAPDILGIQEVLLHQVEYLEEGLPGYSWVGVGREDGFEKGEFAALLFREDRFSLIEQGTFWLSETPDRVSVGWDAALERVCTWARLMDKETDKVFVVFNAHFDHQGEEARLESAKLILAKARNWMDQLGEPVIVMGDLNANPASEVLQTLRAGLKDTFNEAGARSGPEGTWNGFEPGKEPGDRIDYVLVSPDFKVLEYHTPAPVVSGRYLSDHFPVVVKLSR